MGVSYSNKSIVTGGLVFYIDPANPRSYVSGSLTSYNLINNPSISGSIQDDGMYNSNSSTCWEFFASASSGSRLSLQYWRKDEVRVWRLKKRLWPAGNLFTPERIEPGAGM